MQQDDISVQMEAIRVDIQNTGLYNAALTAVVTYTFIYCTLAVPTR